MPVYFARDDYGLVKIGHSAAPVLRVRTLSKMSGKALSLVRVVRGGQDVERAFHRRYWRQRVLGEWFTWSDGMMRSRPRLDESVVKVQVPLAVFDVLHAAATRDGFKLAEWLRPRLARAAREERKAA